MTFEEAKTIIRDGCDNWPRLVEAASVVCDEPGSSFEDLLACLRHRGLPSEFAAMRLYKRTERPRADKFLVMDRQDWNDYLRQRGLL